MTTLPLRLGQQLRSVTELDRLKGALRQTAIMDESHSENSAEHHLFSGVVFGLTYEHLTNRRGR